VRTNPEKTLPKMLAGSVCAQWVRCGRPNCHCARGRLHGPYHYRFFRHRGRLRKRYVKPADIGDVRAGCEARREARRRDRRELAVALREFRRIQDLLRVLGQR
jgi:hypothetical protein